MLLILTLLCAVLCFCQDFTSDGSKVLSAGMDHSVKMWDIATEEVQDVVDASAHHTHSEKRYVVAANGGGCCCVRAVKPMRQRNTTHAFPPSPLLSLPLPLPLPIPPHHTGTSPLFEFTFPSSPREKSTQTMRTASVVWAALYCLRHVRTKYLCGSLLPEQCTT